MAARGIQQKGRHTPSTRGRRDERLPLRLELLAVALLHLHVVDELIDVLLPKPAKDIQVIIALLLDDRVGI